MPRKETNKYIINQSNVHLAFDNTLHNMPFPEQGHLLVLANAAALILTLTARPYTNRQKMKVTVIAKVHQTFCLNS